MSEQAKAEIIQLYREGGVNDIAQWIYRSIEVFKNAFPSFPSDVVHISVIDAPYPNPERDQSVIIGDMNGKHTLPISFSLGYAAGVLMDPDMSVGYELLLNTLESMRFHYNVQYGVAKFKDDLPGFIVKVPSSTQAHIRVEILPRQEPSAN
jgi:hypothetical protein